MRIIFPFCSYKEASAKSGLMKLSDRRQELVDKLFKKTIQSEQNKLHDRLYSTFNKNTLNIRNKV